MQLITGRETCNDYVVHDRNIGFLPVENCNQIYSIRNMNTSHSHSFGRTNKRNRFDMRPIKGHLIFYWKSNKNISNNGCESSKVGDVTGKEDINLEVILENNLLNYAPNN